MSWSRKQHYNAGLETRLLSGFFLIYSFLEAFFYCGTLSAPRNEGLRSSYGSRMSVNIVHAVKSCGELKCVRFSCYKTGQYL